MNKNKGFTLVEMTVTLVIFGALLLLIVNINQEMNYNQAVRLGAGGVVDLVETSSKVLNNNYNNLINLQKAFSPFVIIILTYNFMHFSYLK